MLVRRVVNEWRFRISEKPASSRLSPEPANHIVGNNVRPHPKKHRLKNRFSRRFSNGENG
jgi:hypothetical protein